MPYCRKCGAELDEIANFCPKCGTPVASSSTPQRTQPTRSTKMPISPWLIAGIAVLAVVLVVVLVAIPLLLGGLLPFGQAVGSGNLRTEQEAFSNFTNVELGSGFRFHIVRASSYSVAITTDDNLFNYIRVSKTGDTLSIGLAPNIGVQSTVLNAEISMPDIQMMQLSGGANGTATGFVMSHDFSAELSGGSILIMDGRADNLVAQCIGGSNLDLGDFSVQNARVDFSGGSQGTIDADGTISGSLSGGSRLFYVGNPTLEVNTSGGSSISRR